MSNGKIRNPKIESSNLFTFNPVIRWLIISDIVIFGASGLLAPIFAVFISDFLPGGNVQTAGIAITIYLLTKSLIQIPTARMIDKIKGDNDDFLFLIIGTIVMSVVPLLYLFVSNVWHLYLVQFASGLAAAAAFPAYMALFTRHIDRGREGTEWGIYFTTADLAAAATGAIGGTLALYMGFQLVFILVAILSFFGGLSLIVARKYNDKKIKKLDKKVRVLA